MQEGEYKSNIMRKSAGTSFSMYDKDILAIDSPSQRVEGPWVVVYKDSANRWAIVALDWDGKPSLGIRWFYGNSGTPISSSYATWFIIPEDLIPSIVSGLLSLSVSSQLLNDLQKYLNGTTTGQQLQKHIINSN